MWLPAAVAAPTHGRPAAAAPALYGAASGGRVIVVLKKQYSNLTLRARGQARTAATTSRPEPDRHPIKKSGGTGITRLVSVDAVAAKISAAEVTKLAPQPGGQGNRPRPADRRST